MQPLKIVMSNQMYKCNHRGNKIRTSDNLHYKMSITMTMTMTMTMTIIIGRHTK